MFAYRPIVFVVFVACLLAFNFLLDHVLCMFKKTVQPQYDEKKKKILKRVLTRYGHSILLAKSVEMQMRTENERKKQQQQK